MRIDIVTIFPGMFKPVLGASILKRAQEQGRLTLSVHDLRRFTHDKRRTVDDRPFGGGPGMVMKPEPIFEAVEAIRMKQCADHAAPQTDVAHAVRSAVGRPKWVGGCQTVLMAPQGEPLSSPQARELAGLKHLIVICGRYEGVDERVRTGLADRSVSIGDYVLTGGELPAMVMIDCLARYLPGVIGHAQATEEESFAEGWLEYPQFTRPPVFRDMRVPEVLLSGDHARIAHWRKVQSIARTLDARPDLAGQGAPGTRPVRARRGALKAQDRRRTAA